MTTCIIILLITLILIGVYLMATIADVSTKLDTVQSNVATLQAAIAAAPSQAAIDALDAKAAALVTASIPPTPAT